MADEQQSIPAFFDLIIDLCNNYVREYPNDFDSVLKGWDRRLKSTYCDEGLEPVLKQICHLLNNTFEASDFFTEMTGIIADASREPEWRVNFGRHGVLANYVELLRQPHEGEPAKTTKDRWAQDWVDHALRLIGNCCADLNDNRQLVLDQLDLQSLVKKLSDICEEDQMNITMVVIHNMCSEFEPAQKAFAALELFKTILHCFPWNSVKGPYYYLYFSQACRLLEMTSDNPNLWPLWKGCIPVLGNLITRHRLDVDDQFSLSIAISAILTVPAQQDMAIEWHEVNILQDLFVHTYTQVRTAALTDNVLPDSPENGTTRLPENSVSLDKMRDVYVNAMWSLFERPKLCIHNPPTSEFIKVYVAWISAAETIRQYCALSTLRLYVSSESLAEQIFQAYLLCQPLLDILLHSQDIRVLEEALRLLKNLALPLRNRRSEDMANASMITAVTKIIRKPRFPTSPKYAAVRLLRQLMTGTPQSVDFFLNGFMAPDAWSIDQPIQPPPFGISIDFSPLAHFLLFYSAVGDVATKMEIGRTVVELWRTVQAYPFLPVAKDVRRIPEKYADIAKPVVALIMESENASLVTEGWFGLNLIAFKTKAGGVVVYNALSEAQALARFEEQVLRRAIKTEDGQNILMLASQLVKLEVGSPEWRLALTMARNPRLHRYQ